VVTSEGEDPLGGEKEKGTYFPGQSQGARRRLGKREGWTPCRRKKTERGNFRKEKRREEREGREVYWGRVVQLKKLGKKLV